MQSPNSDDEIQVSEYEDHESGAAADCQAGVPLNNVGPGEEAVAVYRAEEEAAVYRGPPAPEDYGGASAADPNSMLWTCDICDTSVNIFTRDDHLASRSHIRAAGRMGGVANVLPAATASPAYLPMWRCAICDEEMSIFLREDHVAGKAHAHMVRHQMPEEGCVVSHASAGGGLYGDPAESQSSFPRPQTPEFYTPSSSYRLRKTFYCITCAGEFDLATEGLHSIASPTWECTLCVKTLHHAAKEMHLQSEGHLTMQNCPQNIHCGVCNTSCSRVEWETHVEGVGHQVALARIELEKQYRKGLEQLQRGEAAAALTCGVATLSIREGAEVAAEVKKKKGREEGGGKEREQETVNEKQREVVRERDPGWDRMFKMHAERERERRKNVKGWGSKKEKAMERKKREEYERQKKKQNGTAQWKCDVCHEPLLGVLLSNHRLWHCRATVTSRAPNPGQPQPVPPPTAISGPPAPQLPYETFFCDTCEKHIGLIGHPGHLKGQKHLKKAAAKAQAEAAARAKAEAAARAKAKAKETAAPPPTLFAPESALRPHSLGQVGWDSEWVTILGQKFHCAACKRDEQVEGIEQHLRGQEHKKNVRLVKEAQMGG